MTEFKDFHEYSVTDEKYQISARDLKVIDFACFLNKRETVNSTKRRNERKSEVSNKIQNKLKRVRLDALEDKDYDEMQDNYSQFKMSERIENTKTPSSINSKIIPQDKSNSPSKIANYLSKIRLNENNYPVKNTNTKFSPYLKEQLSKALNDEIKNLREKGSKEVGEITSLIEQCKADLEEKSRIESEIQIKKSYLTGIKEERNKLIAEKHILNNELDYIKHELKISKDSNNKKIGQINYGCNYSDLDCQLDNQTLIASFDKIIEDLEEKIFNLTIGSQATKEQLENINSEIKKNEQNNKKYKSELAKQEKIIDELIKEKFNLMKNNKFVVKEPSFLELEEKGHTKR